MRIHKIKPQAGQESVWDYPRPPALEPFKGQVVIIYNGQTIIDTRAAYRLLETSHPPTYYLPINEFRPGVLKGATRNSFCEYKGRASYYHIEVQGKIALDAAWQYPQAASKYSMIKDHVAVYAHMMDACFVNQVKVQAH